VQRSQNRVETSGSEAHYEIIVQGSLDERWSDWFSGLTLTREPEAAANPVTRLTGLVADQAALRGILNRLWDLNLTLVSVNRL
jgi:hypothetical protein